MELEHFSHAFQGLQYGSKASKITHLLFTAEEKMKACMGYFFGCSL